MRKIRILFKQNCNVIVFIISITALSFSILRCEPMKADWISILVGILSLLVTALIGWQVYSIIDFKERAKELSQIKESLNTLSKDMSQSTSEAYWGMYLAYSKSQEYPGAITSLIVMIKLLLNDVRSNMEAGNFKRVQQKLNKSIDCFNKSSNKYQPNNCEILRKSINKIINHKDYGFIKNDFDEIFNRILDAVRKEEDSV